MKIENTKIKIELSRLESSAIKGIAILLMIFHHVFLDKNRVSNFTGSYFPLSKEIVIHLAACSKICVSLFAFVSGYGLLYSLREKKLKELDYKDWTYHHLLSSLNVFWFISFLMYVLTFVLNKFFNFWSYLAPSKLGAKIVFSIIDILGIENLLNPAKGFTLCESWWYIGAAITFIIFAPFLERLISKFGSFLVFVFVIIFPHFINMKYPGGINSISFLPIFVFGMICCKDSLFDIYENLIFCHNKIISEVLKCVFIFISILLCVYLYSKIDSKNFYEFKFLLFPIVVIFFCKQYLFKITWLTKILAYFGKHSLNIWLIHTFIRTNLQRFHSKIPHFMIIPIVVLVLSLIGSYIINFLMKITQYNRFIKYLDNKIQNKNEEPLITN